MFPSVARRALIIASISSGVAIALLVAASLGIWMEGAYLHPTPRINALTVGCGIVPIPAIAWIVYLWSCIRLNGWRAALLVLASCVLLLVAGCSLVMSLFEAFFVG